MSQLKQLLDQIDHIKNQDSSCLPESFLNETDLKNMYSAITSRPAPKYRETDLEPAPGNHFPKPEDLDHLVSHFFSQLDFSRHTLHPVELAAMAYKRIVDMAPFEEKNQTYYCAISVCTYSISSALINVNKFWAERSIYAPIGFEIGNFTK